MSIPPGAYVRIRNASEPNMGPCPLCTVFAGNERDENHEPIGRIWKRFDVPMPPFHINCNCWAITYYPSPEEVQTELPPMDELTHNALINLLISYILADYPIPELLQPYVEEAQQKMRQQNTTTITTRLQLAADADELRAVLVQAGPTRTITGQPGRHSFTAEAIVAALHDGLFENLSCFADHSHGHPSVRDLLGVWTDATYNPVEQTITATLSPFDTDANRPLLQLLAQLRAQPDHRPDVGISVVIYPAEATNGRITRIQSVESADLVMFPAVEAARFQFQGEPMSDNQPQPLAAPQWPQQPAADWDEAYRQTAARAIIAHSELPAIVRERLSAQRYQTPEDVEKAIENARAELAALHDQNVINLPGRPRVQVRDPLDEARDLWSYMFGAADAPTPAANMRRVDQLYVAMTGDVHFRGVFDPTRVQFAGATTATLADMAANAMNKVMVEQFQAMDHWRWFERIASVEPNDGTLNPMKWITISGISNLPTVAEGASYTELAVSDVAENDSFAKYGGYVGITRELIKNSQIAKMQAIPRALATAALRTRSAAVSAIFTSNSGVGPTLEQDSTALFETNTHKNLLTTALGTDATAWRAARAECFQHTEVGSGKALGIYPRFLLVPAELYDTALSILGYGEGMPTTYAPEAQARGFVDPRPIPLVVPDWTDATDWAYIVDPAVFPVIQMSYSQNPGGRNHPTPELYAVTSEQSGLLFSNDTLPIKVRDEFAVGVNGPRGIGKRNVAG
jgi:hypothetical protein